MPTTWKRQENLDSPKCYYKFTAVDLEVNQLVEYRVEDIPEHRYVEAVEFMIKHFVPYEPKLIARNGKDDPLVIEDYYNKYMNGIRQKVSVGCFKAGSNEFIGVNILEVLGRNDGDGYFEMKSQTCLDNMECVRHILDKADVFNNHNEDYYLSGTGLAIDVAYCGRGVATEMLKARESILKFIGVAVTSTGFSSVGSQIAAKKAGYKVDCEMTYAELATLNPKWEFKNIKTKSYIQMSFKVDK